MTMQQPVRLNLGAGDVSVPGFIPLDGAKGDTIYPLSYPDDHADEIRASHVLEHFPHGEIDKVFAEWVRVLKPGGRLRIAVPDFAWIANAYNSDAPDSYGLPLQGFVMGGQTDERDYHRAIFDHASLKDLFRRHGLVDVQRWHSDVNDCARYDVSLNLQGRKKPEPKVEGVFAIMSLPRLAFTTNMFRVMETVSTLRLPIIKSSGVFWGACLTRMMEKAIAAGAKYVLTIDYDSVFSWWDVVDLYNIAEANPEYSAVMAMQSGRGGERAPLFTMQDNQGNVRKTATVAEFDRDVIEAATGHFGLTLIRTDQLSRLPRPWMCPVPDDAGRWGEGRTDEDVTFWKRFTSTGRKLGLCPRVRIGHIEQSVIWTNHDMSPIWQTIDAYDVEGKPEL